MHIADLGVEAAEICLQSPSEYAPAFCGLLSGIMNAKNLNLVAVHPQAFYEAQLFSRYPRQFRDALGLFRRGLRACADIAGSRETPYIVHGPHAWQIREYGDAFILERLAELADLAQPFGALLALENRREYAAENPADWALYGQACAGVILDTGHCQAAGFTPEQYLGALDAMPRLERPALLGVHLRQHVPHQSGRGITGLPTPDGADWAALLVGLSRRGYEGPLTIEAGSRGLGPHWARSLRQAVQYIDGLLREPV